MVHNLGRGHFRGHCILFGPLHNLPAVWTLLSYVYRGEEAEDLGKVKPLA